MEDSNFQVLDMQCSFGMAIYLGSTPYSRMAQAEKRVNHLVGWKLREKLSRLLRTSHPRLPQILRTSIKS